MEIPQEPAIADIPASPSDAYALGFRHGWLDCFAAGENLYPETYDPRYPGVGRTAQHEEPKNDG